MPPLLKIVNTSDLREMTLMLNKSQFAIQKNSFKIPSHDFIKNICTIDKENNKINYDIIKAIPTGIF